MGLAVLNPGLLVFVMLLLIEQNHNCAQKTDAAFPHIDPNRLQFFEYESIKFSCDGLTGSDEWRVSKNTVLEATRWANSTRTLRADPAFEGHSGEYWCENEEGKRSNVLNITVTAGNVILESPVLPLKEGQTATLHCRRKSPPRGLVSDFYKDGQPIGTGYQGMISIRNVSESNEGLYKCSISGAGESPESRLSVRAYNSSKDRQHTPSSPGSWQLTTWLSVFFAIFFVTVLLLVARLLYQKLRVGRFFSGSSRTESAPVYENYSAADQEQSVYANVPKKKKKRGRLGQGKKKTQESLTTVGKEKGSGASVVPREKRAQQKREKGLYVESTNEELDVIKTERERRAPGEAAAPGTKNAKARKKRESQEQKS